MKNKKGCLMTLTLVWLACSPLSWGQDVMDLRGGWDLASGPRPEPGWSMAVVRRQFGEPIRRIPPVGQPPISRWVYPDFIVYFDFEHQHTIHAVWTAPSSAMPLP
jgi:hypothetical protein